MVHGLTDKLREKKTQYKLGENSLLTNKLNTSLGENLLTNKLDTNLGKKTILTNEKKNS